MRRALLTSALILLASGTASAQLRPLTAVEADRIRIREHLTRVEEQLRAADVSDLTDAQRAARELNIERLHAYRLAGEFPHGNPAQPGPRVPTFIDADGRACAMGHLVIESGHRDVAEAIARDQNYARVPEIAHPALVPWLEANGMTLEEATLVQPSYCFECADAGTQAVCTSDGYVYPNECLAVCEGQTVVGPASCTGGTCTCGDSGTLEPDAGPPEIDSGAPGIDSGTPMIEADSGSGTVVPRSGGCAAGGTSSAGAWSLAAPLVLLAMRRRRQ
jgi:hypothetical protein